MMFGVLVLHSYARFNALPPHRSHVTTVFSASPLSPTPVHATERTSVLCGSLWTHKITGLNSRVRWLNADSEHRVGDRMHPS